MLCPACRHDNPPQNAFCGGCGAGLVRGCPACGRAAPPGDRFCGGCGAPIDTDLRRPSPAQPAHGEDRAERRQVTVLFCDLVDSTRLAAGRDPEEWRDVIRSYQEAAREVVERFDGHVAQHQGDGVVVYFGWPRAHEDDAERAVRAGLGIVQAIAQRNPELERRHGIALHARVGLHTGPVVIEEIGSAERRETLASGETTNVAARLQGIAEPDSVVLSAATLRLVQGIFLTEDLGLQRLKGIDQPVPAYRALRGSGVRSRLDVATAGDLTPLVGREQELGLLLDRWEQVREGTGQAVIVSGEAGIGKSRIVEAFRERLADTPHTWLECRCSPYARDSALYPVIDLLHQALLLAPDASREEKLEQLEAALRFIGFDVGASLPLAARLLSLPVPADYAEPELSAEARRRRTLALLAEWLLRLGRHQPVLLLVEDLHWVDPSTLELLAAVLEQVPTAAVLALYTYRPDFQAPWSGRSHVTPILLPRLTRQQVRQMIEGAAHGRPVPEAWVREIVRRTDGVPLFVEELTRTLLDSEVLEGPGAEDVEGALARVSIPATLQDSLMARLDQLGPVKEIAQLASCLGREFSFDLLLAVSTLVESELAELLARAVDTELFYQRGAPPDAIYMFKHALLEEAAYQSLLRSTRQRHHRRIAETLEKRFPELVEERPELLAHHYQEAAAAQDALRGWEAAGARALQRSANAEAASHLRRALRLLEALPEDAARFERELDLRVRLGVAAMASHGYGSEEVARAFARARELCGELGETPRRFAVLFGVWLFHMARAERKQTRELAEELVRLAERSGDPGFLLEARLAAGATAHWEGRHREAVELLGAAGAFYDPVAHAGHAYVYGQDPLAWHHVLRGRSLWALGFPDRGRAELELGIRHARARQHPFTLAGALNFACWLHLQRGEVSVCAAYAEEMLALSTEQQLSFWIPSARGYLGFARFLSGEAEEGEAAIDEGQAGLVATGIRVSTFEKLGVTSECHLHRGRRAEGLAAVAAALATSRAELDRLAEPELLRLRGELLLLEPAEPEAAETSLLDAIELAQRQEARSLELRAATSLARAWHAQGRATEARGLLLPLHAAFTEGHETRDLRAARELLDALGR